MTTKYFGPSVSGYDVPDGRAWETVCYSAGKPILDRENNLVQDIDGGAAQTNLRTSMPSGWLSDDFLTTSDPTSAIFTYLATANALKIPNGLKAHVNGWIVNVQHSYANGHNQLDLGASPTGAGAQRTDLVVLEVWRRLLSASPSTVGKSAAARIWQEGNVATDPASDVALNYADDILDAAVGSETTKRVQIQYRLRVVQGIDIFGNPYGLDDVAVVFANSVPVVAGAPNGVATLFNYANQSANGDPGLWIAGDGNPANTLGTVDGYMYAIPLMAVFRRNDTAWNRVTNQNGGVSSVPGPSDRPDGLFYDLIVAEDIVDLRLGVSPTGWSLPELLEKNANFLFDNTLRSEIGDTFPYGGGCRGTTVFSCNEIGSSSSGAGPLIDDFDSVRRRFSDRSIFETVTVVVAAPMGGWVGTDTVTVNPSALAPYPYTAFNWDSFAPAEVRFLDVTDIRWIAPVGAVITEDAAPYIVSITGLGARPIASLTITTAAVLPVGITNEPLYVTLLVGYPMGVGLDTTPIVDFSASSFEVVDPLALPAAPPIDYSSLSSAELDYPHREVHLEYTTTALTFSAEAGAAGVGSTVVLPERAATIVGLTVNGAPVVGYTLDVSGRIITLPAPVLATDNIAVGYTARRPLPQNINLLPGTPLLRVAIYYRAAVVQAARNALLSTSITVVPKLVNKTLYALTTGSGSQDEGYPFPYMYVQTGGIYPSTAYIYSGESELSASAEISITDFNAETGFLGCPIYIPMVANPESLTFNRAGGDVDVEGRTFFKTVPAGYIPNAYGQDLSNADRHKNVVPLIAELAADSPLGFKGQLVLILLLRYAHFDSTNGVWFDSDLSVNSTSASVFRLKGLLLNKRQA